MLQGALKGLCTVGPWKGLLSYDSVLPSEPWGLGEGSWGSKQPEAPPPRKVGVQVLKAEKGVPSPP